MKLLSKTTLINLAAFVLAFTIAGFSVFVMMEKMVRDEVLEQLSSQQAVINKFAENIDSVSQLQIPGLRIEPIWPNKAAYFSPYSSDTVINIWERENPESPLELESVPHRVLNWQQEIAGKPYLLHLQIPLLERDDAVRAIAWGLIPIALLLTLAMVFILRWASKRIWRPFDKTLIQISQFSPQHPELPHFEATATHEFARLNSILESMTRKVYEDYQHLKAFTDNAAHEMQTPLSIVQSQLEGLLQSSQLGESEVAYISGSLSAIQRLRRLNEGLLTLSRIEHSRQSNVEALALEPILRQQVERVKEFAQLKEIEISMDVQAHPQLKIKTFLLELILSNLLSNAIRHNVPNGKIKLEIRPNALIISNTGSDQALQKQLLFKRFQKQNPESPGSGLGLSIVKESCRAADLEIHYHFVGGMHTFRLDFNP